MFFRKFGVDNQVLKLQEEFIEIFENMVKTHTKTDTTGYEEKAREEFCDVITIISGMIYYNSINHKFLSMYDIRELIKDLVVVGTRINLNTKNAVDMMEMFYNEYTKNDSAFHNLLVEVENNIKISYNKVKEL